jgi:hypothetical protein
VEHFADVEIEGWSLDPLHEQDRKSRAADEYSFRRVAELREVRHRRRENVFLNRSIALVSIAEITAETAHGEVAASIHRLQFVDVGKLARRNDGHAEAIDCRQCFSQDGMREADRRALNHLGEVPG